MQTEIDSLSGPVAAILDHLEKPAGEQKRKPGEFPYFITTADGVLVFLTDPIVRALHVVADVLWDEQGDRAVLHTRDEWWRLTQKALAAALRRENQAAERTVAIATIVSELRNYMTERSRSHRTLEFAFACSLLQEPERTLPAFEHARLETREAWLVRKAAEGMVSAVTARRIQATWTGKKLAKRRPLQDQSDERHIVGGIGAAEFVCTVKTQGFAPQAAEQRALMAARLALLSVSLLWARPVRALRGLNLAFDGLSQTRSTLVFAGQHVLGGWREDKEPHAPWSPKEDWEDIVTAYGPALAAADEAIGFVLAAPGSCTRPRLMLTLSQAMLWFHEACREPLDLMAIVNCAVALDALASGERAKGIRKLICARLGIGLHDASIGALTPNDIVHQVYECTRNQAAHGREPPFGRDWSRTRILAETTTRRMIIECLHWANDHPTVDDPGRLCTA